VHPNAVANFIRTLIAGCAIVCTHAALADWPTPSPSAPSAMPSATFSGSVYEIAQAPSIPRTTYDDRQQSVYILDGPPTSGMAPTPVSPNLASGAVTTAGIYPGAIVPTGPALAQPAVYQPGQQFQLLDAPHPGTAQPISYSTIEQPCLPPGCVVPDGCDCCNQPWTWQVLPTGLIWHSDLAGPKEPRIGGEVVSDTGVDTKLDGSVGGRAGLIRYGNIADFRPQGWQFDVEGGAIIRQDLTQDSDVDAYDFRIGFPLTYGWGDYQMKLAWYHTSAHLGDEFMLKHPTFTRINYSRNALVWGNGYFLTPDLRIYGELEYAYFVDGGSRPWAFQCGIEYNPVVRGWRGAPFFDINAYLKQENDWGGPLTVETGWQWRPMRGGQLVRTGFFYQTGPSVYGQFFRDSEQLIGYGLWYDF
jgi:hypothetical protein